MNRYINQIIESLDFAKIESARIIHRCEEIEKMIDKLCKYYKMDNEVLTDLHSISSVFESIVANEIHIDSIARRLSLSWLLEINSLKGDEIDIKEDY